VKARSAGPSYVAVVKLAVPLMMSLPATLAAQTPSFIYVRGAAGSANSMYAAYSLGLAAAVFGMVVNPRSGYHEVIAGGVIRVAHRGGATLLALTTADASDSWYLQLYVVPSITVGRASFGGTLELYQPLERKGTYDLDVNPINALVRIAPGVSVGPSYKIGLAEGAVRKQAAGLMVQTTIPRGSISVEWLAGLARAGGDVRASLSAAF
jgi:hypothetical protein